MPITPKFSLSQSCTHLKLTIYLPHIRVNKSNMELVVDGTSVHFYASPYLLVLPNLPGELLDDESVGKEAHAIFDPSRENGILDIQIWKRTEELWDDDLDMIGKFLLHPNHSQRTTIDPERSIQILHSSQCHDDDDDKEESHPNYNTTIPPTDIRNKNDSSLLFSNNEEEEEPSIIMSEKLYYGFDNQFHSVFTSFAREGLANEMLELPNPDTTTTEDRQKLRLMTEHEKFDPDRYLADTMDGDKEDMVYQEAILCNPHYIMTPPLTNQNNNDDDDEKEKRNKTEYFTREESLLMANISTSVQFPSTNDDIKNSALLLNLLDILYAYVYNYRTTGGDATCESSWTISILSPTLSWLESYSSIKNDPVQVLGWCINRALTYPYLRSYDFCTKIILSDIGHIFQGGRRCILKCLLQIHEIMDKSEYHYLNNKLMVDPLILWIQCMDESIIQNFAQNLHDKVMKKTPTKKDFGLEHLLQIEHEYLCTSSDDSEYSSDDSEISSTSSCNSSTSAKKVASNIKKDDDDINQLNEKLDTLVIHTIIDKCDEQQCEEVTTTNENPLPNKKRLNHEKKN